MRLPCALALAVALSLACRTSMAEGPDLALGFVSGVSVFAAGFAAGGALLGTKNASSAQDNAGWLTIEAGFVLAPMVSHAVAGEWARGAVFAAPPAAAWGGTAALFAAAPNTIEHGSIEEQRVMWSLFGAGILAASIGVVDTTFAGRRKRAITAAPMLGAGRVGVELGATL